MILSLLLLSAVPLQGETVAGVPYQKRATRAETYEAMRAAIVDEPHAFGEFFLLSPFPYSGHGNQGLRDAHPPEQELARYAAGGPGPDLARRYTGRKELDIGWTSLGFMVNRKCDLNVFDDPELNDNGTAYVYFTIEAREDADVPVTMGSDDGLRFWLNGRLLIDHDVERGMTPDDEKLTLPLKRGTNHALAKIVEGVGGWDYQINGRLRLPDEADAHLAYLLDRDFPLNAERDAYSVLSYPLPEDVVLEVGGLATLGDGRPIVCTRRGEVWIVEDAYGVPPLGARFTLFAQGLHEPLGLAVRQDVDGESVYCAQRGELTRLVDTDGDDRADLYEAFCTDWGVSGNYHEFAFGPKFDDEGNAWVTLNVGFCGSLGKAIVPWRGWAVKITPAGALIPVCDGLRSPNGIEFLPSGEALYVDNQGDYVATNRLNVLAPGSWAGHPASLRWREGLDAASERPPRQKTSVWFPYKKMGQSTADILYDDTEGAFGPFAGQLFVGEQTYGEVQRVFLEQVEGHWQGACFPFVKGLDCGVNRLAWAPDGSLLVGETDRGWGSTGRKPYGLQRIVWKGVTPFEVHAIRARADGFEVTFTEDADPAATVRADGLAIARYTYEYHAQYGAPEDDTQEVAVTDVSLTAPNTLRVAVDRMVADYVYEFDFSGARSKAGAPLVHANAYYTLAVVPGAQQAAAPEALPRVLFLTHSAGFTHDVVKRPDPLVLSHAEERLVEAARGRLEVTATQDCGDVEAANLADYDAVMFYTTGELPISEAGRAALIDFVRGGGAFVGVHSATDTFYEYQPYMDMIGGGFDGHPWHREVGVVVEDGAHPSTAALGERFTITDEIYQYKNWRRWPPQVLLSLDPGSVDISKGKRDDGDYPISWVRPFGAGQVFYSSLGHRPEVWRDARFLEHVLSGLEWAVAGVDHPPRPPAGASVLVGDGSLDAWHARDDGKAWRSLPGAIEAAGAGDLVSRQEFGDALVHVEFRLPERSGEEGAHRANSGVYLMGRYEVQILDSLGNEPGPGQCGGLYGQAPPESIASRPPGSWESFDLEFRAPRFDASGAKTEDARVSVWHNGVPIQRDVALPGPTPGGIAQDEVPRGPLLLQDHGDPVRFRNVWVLAR